MQETAEKEGEKKTTKRRGRQADKPQQEATHTHRALVCACTQEGDCTTERAIGKGREGE